MLNKHENPSETSKSKRQKQKTKRMYDEHEGFNHPKSSILSIFSFSVCLLPYGKRLSDCLIGTALPVLILCYTKTVQDWPRPKTPKQMRGFLGLCSYYRKYVKNFAIIARPLHKMCEKGSIFQWNDVFFKISEFIRLGSIE
jgi:hypothetical protein